MSESTGRRWLPTKIGRRRLIGLAAIGTGAALVGARPWRPPIEINRVDTPGPLALPPPEDRVLVVIEQRGGNDALNTLAPLGWRYDQYRPRLGLDESEVLRFTDLELGVHPSLAPLEPLWQRGQIAAVLGTAPAASNRSHFVARDHLHLGADLGDGVIGRYGPDAGTGVWGLALGGPSRLLQGPGHVPVVSGADELVSLAERARGIDDLLPSLAALVQGARELGIGGHAPPGVGSFGELIEPLVEWARADDHPLDLFDVAAFAISHWPSLRVVHLVMNGWDTHAAQRVRHEPLLDTFASGIDRLFSRLHDAGRAEASLVVSVSEFGRSARENGSGGTDHGTAGMSFIIGPAVNGRTVAGEFRLDVLERGGLLPAVDTRSCLNVGLRWVGLPEIGPDANDRLDLLRR